MTSATPDLRLPSQLQNTAIVPSLVHTSRPTEGTRLSCHERLVTYQNSIPLNGRPSPGLGYNAATTMPNCQLY